MSPHPSQVEPLKRLMKIVNAFLSRPDIGPFREPVDWRGLGLDDYPKIVKHMMDLGTVKRKLERKSYYTATQCADDIRLIWSNCMAYNADGSDFWLLAKAFQRRFEDRYRKVRQEFDCGLDLEDGDEENPDGATTSGGGGAKSAGTSRANSRNGSMGDDSLAGDDDDDDDEDAISLTAAATTPPPAAAHPPPLDTRTRFRANLFFLSGVELAQVIMKLEQACPEVLEHVTEAVPVEDTIPSTPGEDDTSSTATPSAATTILGGISFSLEQTLVPTAKLEINVDAIPAALFQELQAYVTDRVGTKGQDEQINSSSHARGTNNNNNNTSNKRSSSASATSRPKKKKKT